MKLEIEKYESYDANKGGEDTYIGGYDFSAYATKKNHIKNVRATYEKLSENGTVGRSQEYIDKYIKKRAPNSPLNASMFWEANAKTGVTIEVLVAEAQIDSMFGTVGKGSYTNNPGNVGNNDAGQLWTFNSWQDGVNAIGMFLTGTRGRENFPGPPAVSWASNESGTINSTMQNSTLTFVSPNNSNNI
jgi:hypothetical protein